MFCMINGLYVTYNMIISFFLGNVGKVSVSCAVLEMLECSVQVWFVFLVFSLTCILLADVTSSHRF